MARKEFSVDELVEVLHQWHKGRSITQIKHSVGMDRKTIRKYIDLADGHGFSRDMGFLNSGDTIHNSKDSRVSLPNNDSTLHGFRSVGVYPQRLRTNRGQG